ncbi:AF4/FMR2 family member 1-like [Pezoporus flaviventris]|uniref:AF4/FMR2 family member 1-like n=1 Tax=Pezoporus flaviventris TaxID=889875 RepID=UPI002AB1D69F|nr:AF4/FMR2 family member 1-like [Pezoporus flaviventris]
MTLCNEDRNLLHARERERRIGEAQQEKNKLPEKPPVFAAPYKTHKGDDLSNQIRNVLGNYEDVMGLINSKTQWNFLGLQEVLPPVSPEAPHFPHSLDENTSPTSSPSFHDTAHHPPTTAVSAPPAHRSSPCEKAQSRTKPHSGLHVQSGSSSNGQSQSRKRSCGDKESHEGLHRKGSDRRAAGEGRAHDLDYSIFSFSSFLTPLPPPLEPLSPLRSDLHVSSKSEKSSKSQELTYSQRKSFQDLVTGSEEEESQDGSDIDLSSNTRPSSRTVPTALPSKPSAMQQKPTACVRPMDVQDQAREESPDLKPLLEEYHREPFEKISDLKVNARARLFKSEIPSEPVKQTFRWDAQAVKEILKEMTQSWPPLLTDIPTPPTAEPSKFPLPTKESQPVGCVAQNQRQCDGPSDTLPRSQTTVSVLLQEDLQVSDSEDSDDNQPDPPTSSKWQPGNCLTKRKAVDEETNRKKLKSEKEKKSLNSSPKKDSKKLKASNSKASYEYWKKDFQPPPLPPLCPIPPAPKSTKVAQKRRRSQNDELSAIDNTTKTESNNKDPLICKHRKVQSNEAELSKDIKGSAGHVTKLFPVPSLPNGTSQPKRPQLKFERQYPAEYYAEEARRLKHKADAMTDKIAKAFQYLESALFFIEYGIALEANAQNFAYKIFQDTTDFIKFIMMLKYCMSPSAPSQEEIFTVLCMRCLSLLNMALFRGKKETAAKYSSILNDHFKVGHRFPTKAPSPSVARSTGMPSPSFPMPSPTTSQRGAGNCSGNSMCSSTAVSSDIPDITYSYVNITSYVLSALNYWERADALILKNQEKIASTVQGVRPDGTSQQPQIGYKSRLLPVQEKEHGA